MSFFQKAEFDVLVFFFSLLLLLIYAIHRSCPDESWCLCQTDDLFYQCLVWAGMVVLPECWMSDSSVYRTPTVCLILQLAAASKLERQQWHCICPQGIRPLMGKWGERQTVRKTIRKREKNQTPVTLSAPALAGCPWCDPPHTPQEWSLCREWGGARRRTTAKGHGHQILVIQRPSWFLLYLGPNNF